MEKTPEKKARYTDDKSVHRVFQIAALLLLGVVVYSLYFEDSKVDGSKEQIDKKVQEAFKKMADTPEYKAVKDFVVYMDQNVDEASPKVLNVKNGKLIYLPQKLLENGADGIKVEDENIRFSISGEKKAQTISKAAEESASQKQSPAENAPEASPDKN